MYIVLEITRPHSPTGFGERHDALCFAKIKRLNYETSSESLAMYVVMPGYDTHSVFFFTVIYLVHVPGNLVCSCAFA